MVVQSDGAEISVYDGVGVNPIIESSAPLLSTFTKEHWRQFIDQHNIYRHRGGSRGIYKLLDPIIFPSIRFHDSYLSSDNLSVLSDKTIIAKFNAIFGEATVLSSLADIKATAMTPTKVFSEEDFFRYISVFSAAIVAAMDISERVQVQLFFEGVQPVWFREYLKRLDSGQARRFSDLSDTVRQGIKNAKIDRDISTLRKEQRGDARSSTTMSAGGSGGEQRRDDRMRLSTTVSAGGGGGCWRDKIVVVRPLTGSFCFDLIKA